MFNLGLFELTLFGIIALIVLGPDKLPQAMRTLGKWYAIFKNTKDRLQSEVANELYLLEAQEQIKQELAKLKQTESELKSQMDKLKASVEQSHKELFDDQTMDWSHSITQTKPMTGQFFFLGDYDKKRRLPNPPFLPNYQADPLLTSSTPNS